MTNINWVIVNCNSKKEAHAIGTALLKERLVACFDVIPEREAVYFWPPKSGKFEKVKGSMVIGVTIAKKYNGIEKLVKKIHSDKTPFIGTIAIDKVNTEYKTWLLNELR
jgi:periplasmic divalent cation tolerance protein